MSAVDIAIQAADLLRGLKTNPSQQTTQQLLTWVQAKGIERLREGLVAFLTEASGKSTVPVRTREMKGGEEPPSFINNSWSVWRVATEAPPPGWTSAFKEAKEVKEISAVLEQDNAACGCHFVPDTRDVFRALYLTPLQSVRVVIVGQDPYHTMRKAGPIADGLAFSVRPPNKPPPSERSIFAELKREYPDFQMPDTGSLVHWAEQGVLLLNISLTTRPKEANAHVWLWVPFIRRIFNAIAAVNPTCIYVLWGKEAQKIRRDIGPKSIVLEAPHPITAQFYGNNHFREINSLISPPIDWSITS